MGEAKQKAEATAAAQQVVANGHSQIRMAPRDFIVCTMLDLTVHFMVGAAEQLAGVFEQREAADEVIKSVKHLQDFKARFVASKRNALVIAQPADLKKLVPG